MNGYLEKDEQKFLWIGKRSEQKSTYPGMLDQLAAGGLVCNTLRLLVSHRLPYVCPSSLTGILDLVSPLDLNMLRLKILLLFHKQYFQSYLLSKNSILFIPY